MDIETDANYSAATPATQATNTTSAETQDPTEEIEMNDIDDKFSALLKLFAGVRDEKQQRALYNAALDLQQAWRAVVISALAKQNELADAATLNLDDTARRLRVDLFDISIKEPSDDSDNDQATA